MLCLFKISSVSRLSFLCFLFSSFLCSQGLEAQQKPAPARQRDGDSALATMQTLLLKSEMQRLRDSVRSAVLTEELQNLKRSSAAASSLRKELEEIRVKDSLRLAAQMALVDSLRAVDSGAPVTLLGDTLFYFFTPVGPFSPAARALSASQRVYDLYDRLSFYPDSVYTDRQNSFANIYYDGRIITSLHETDALWAGQPLDSLVMSYSEVIRNKVGAYRKQYSLRNMLIRAGKAAAILAGVFLLLMWLRRLARRARSMIERTDGFLNEGVRIRNYELLTSVQVRRYLGKVYRVCRAATVLALLYIGLSLLFNVFPTTQSWTDTLTHWIWNPVQDIGKAVYHYFPKLITIGIIIFIARYVTRLIRYFSLEIERGILEIKGFHKEWARPTYIIIRFLWYSFVFVLIFPYLPGSQSTAFKGVSVFLGILFSIGSSSAIANTIAGFVITYMRPFRTGDWIRIGEITGYVVEKTFLVTRIRTINNEDVTVPNSAILAGHTINYSSSAQDAGLVVSAKAGFAYDVEWQTVHRLLKKAALLTADIDTSREPFVFQLTLHDYYITYQVNAYTRRPERMFYIQSELHQHIQDQFREEGIEMAVPHPVDVRHRTPPSPDKQSR